MKTKNSRHRSGATRVLRDVLLHNAANLVVRIPFWFIELALVGSLMKRVKVSKLLN